MKISVRQLLTYALVGGLLPSSAGAAKLVDCLLPLINVGKVSPPETPGSQSVEHYLLRRTKVNGKEFHEVVTIRRFHHEENYTTSVMQRTVNSFGPGYLDGTGRVVSLPNLEPLPFAADELTRMSRPIIAANLATYKERRKHWPKEFRDFLAKVALENINDSIYVAVTDNRSGKIVGGVRFILSPYGVRDGKIVAEGPLVERYYGPVKEFRTDTKKFSAEGLPLPPATIPEELALDIRLDKPAVEVEGDPFGSPPMKSGLNLEMGTLFVDDKLDPKEQKKVWGELWLQTLRMAHHSQNDELNFYGTTIHAYADRPSKKLYLPLGFELLRSYEHKGKRVYHAGPDESVPPITKADGSVWWPIVYRPEKINQFVQEWRDGLHSTRPGEDVPARLLAIADHRDGEPTSVSVDSMERLAKDLLSNEDRRMRGAGYAINRVIEMQAIHARHLREATDPFERKRAQQALNEAERMMRELRPFYPQLVKHPNRHYRAGFLTHAVNLIRFGKEKPVMTPKEVTDEIFLPLFQDKEFWVRQSLPHELRNAFRSAAELRAAVGVTGEPARQHREARDRLLAAGATEAQVQELAKALFNLVEEKKTKIETSDPNVYYQNSRPAEWAYVALLPFEERPISFYRDALILGATYQPAE